MVLKTRAEKFKNRKPESRKGGCGGVSVSFYANAESTSTAFGNFHKKTPKGPSDASREVGHANSEADTMGNLRVDG